MSENAPAMTPKDFAKLERDRARKDVESALTVARSNLEDLEAALAGEKHTSTVRARARALHLATSHVLESAAEYHGRADALTLIEAGES